MILQDGCAVVMVQMETRRRAWAAGALDAGMWLCALATNHYSLNAVNGRSMATKALVVGAVTAANVFGTVAGVKLGDRYFPDPTSKRIADLEAWAATWGYRRRP
jgi:hypothetical protein